jgi:hypothetical protein
MRIREWGLEKLKDEPGLGLSLGYLALTLIGLTYQWALFRRFDVNILDWAEFSDFVFASIHDPLVILLSLPAYGVPWGIQRCEVWLKRKPKYAKKTEYQPWQRSIGRLLSVVIVPMYFYIFVSIFAIIVTNRIKAGQGQRVTLEYNTNVPNAKPVLHTDPKPLWVGATSRAVFLYDDIKKETLIIPQGSIARILVEVKKDKR